MAGIARHTVNGSTGRNSTLAVTATAAAVAPGGLTVFPSFLLSGAFVDSQCAVIADMLLWMGGGGFK